MSNDHVALSRRGFLKGTLATAGVALAGASHAGDIPAEWAKPKCSNWSWEKPMEKIPADQIKKTVDTDVVVIGAGLAGFSAALSAAEEGAKVVVVEKTRSWSARGGHITAFGSKVQKSMKVNVDAAEIVRRLIAWGQGRMDERLLWMFAKKCGACMDWAVDLAAKNDVKVTLWEGYYKGPTYTEFPVTHFFYNKDVSLDYTYGNSTGIGNVVLMPCFEKELKAKGVNIMYRTPAVQLIREKNNGRVTGLIVGRRGNYTRINAKKGVIIATGGFSANVELRAKLNPFYGEGFKTTNLPCAQGDGIFMAEKIGAASVNMEQIQTYPMCDPISGAIELIDDARFEGAILINQEGKRFVEELERRDVMSKAILEQTGKYCYALFNQAVEDRAHAIEHHQDEVRVFSKTGILKTGKTLDEVAAAFDIPADALKATVARVNEFAKTGKDLDFGYRGKFSDLSEGPYWIYRGVPSVHHTMGGLKINPKAQVLDKNDKPIPGLWAAGEVTGCTHGSNRLGSNAYTDIMVFGRIAGTEAAK